LLRAWFYFGIYFSCNVVCLSSIFVLFWVNKKMRNIKWDDSVQLSLRYQVFSQKFIAFRGNFFIGDKSLETLDKKFEKLNGAQYLQKKFRKGNDSCLVDKKLDFCFRCIGSISTCIIHIIASFLIVFHAGILCETHDNDIIFS
jgi:hypothetical protein